MKDFLDKAWTILSGLWRYRWLSMILAWMVAIFGWYMVAKIPNVYHTEAKIYVDTDSVLQPLMRGLTVDTGINQRLRLMARTLLSRPKLVQLANMADLVSREDDPRHVDAVVNSLKASLQLIGDPRQPNLYTLTYLDEDPSIAKKVVDTMIHLLEESTLGKGRQESIEAQTFLEEQVKDYEARLHEAEERVKEFKRKNVDVISNMDSGYFQRLSAEKLKLDQASLELKEAVNKRNELKRQLTGEEPVFGFGAGGLAEARTPIDMRIRELTDQMDEMLLQYTEKHPKVISIKQTIASLQKEKQEMEQSSPILTSEEPIELNPIYQQLKISVGEAEADVSLLQVRVAEYRSRVKHLEELINSVPEIEAQLARLNRNYENDKAQYEALFARLESAKLSEQVDRSGDGVKVNLFEPPRLPTSPAGPNRLMLNSAVLLGGLGAGIVLAFLLSQIYPVVYNQRELRQLTSYPVIGEVSIVMSRETLLKRKIQLGGFLSSAAMLLILYGIVLYIQGSSNLAAAMAQL